MSYLYINNDEKEKSAAQLNENGPWNCNISYEEFKKYHFKKNRKIRFICSECHKPTVGVYQYIHHFICRSCFAKQREQNKDKAAISAKTRQTCLAKYGVENVSQALEVKQKIKESYRSHYGVDHYSQSTESKQHRHEIAQEWKRTNKFANEIWPKIRATWIAKYGYAIDDPEYLNGLRLKSLEKYGVEYPMQSAQCKEQIRKTCLEKYGVDSVNKLESKKALSRKTCIERYGVPYYAQTDEAKIRWSESIQNHYGVSNPIYSQELNKKRLDTLYNHYGVENPTYIGQPTLLKQVSEVKPDTEMISFKDGIFTHRCNECGRIFTSHFQNASCQVCHPLGIESIIEYLMKEIPGFRRDCTSEGVAVDLWHPELNTAIIVLSTYYISYSVRNRLLSNDDQFMQSKAEEFYKYHPDGHLIILTDLEWEQNKYQVLNTIKAQLTPVQESSDIYFEPVTEETARYIMNQYYFLINKACSYYVGVFEGGDLLGVIGYNISNKECHLCRFALKGRYKFDLSNLASYIESNHMVNRIVASVDYRFDNGESLFESGADFIKVNEPNRLYHNGKQLYCVSKKHFKEKIKSILGIDYDNSSDAQDNASDRLYSFLDLGSLLFSIPLVN